jgi:hypothetical protein
MYERRRERMNQSFELFALKRGVDQFLDRVRPLVDKPYDGEMVKISNSTAILIDNLEERVKKAELPSWGIERLRMETWVKGGVINILNVNRKVRAKLSEVRAVFRGEQTQLSEVDEGRIERETVSEVNNLWCEIIWDQPA